MYNNKKVIKDPEGQRGEQMGPVATDTGTPRAQTQGPCSKGKIMLVSSAYRTHDLYISVVSLFLK